MPLKPDPTFYPSPASAAEGPREELAYVVTLNTGSNGDRKPAGAVTRRRSGPGTPSRASPAGAAGAGSAGASGRP